jgi:hypothetical protein
MTEVPSAGLYPQRSGVGRWFCNSSKPSRLEGEPSNASRHRLACRPTAIARPVGARELVQRASLASCGSLDEAFAVGADGACSRVYVVVVFLKPSTLFEAAREGLAGTAGAVTTPGSRGDVCERLMDRMSGYRTQRFRSGPGTGLSTLLGPTHQATATSTIPSASALEAPFPKESPLTRLCRTCAARAATLSGGVDETAVTLGERGWLRRIRAP